MYSKGFKSASRSSALRVLFSLYLTGKIADVLWNQMMNVLDTHATNAEEREALALFFMDAFRELGPESTKIPREEEVQELLTMMHSA